MPGMAKNCMSSYPLLKARSIDLFFLQNQLYYIICCVPTLSQWWTSNARVRVSCLQDRKKLCHDRTVHKNTYCDLMLSPSFQCIASGPIAVVSFLRVGVPSNFNMMLPSYFDVSVSTALLLFYMLVLETLAVLYLVYEIFSSDNTCNLK